MEDYSSPSPPNPSFRLVLQDEEVVQPTKSLSGDRFNACLVKSNSTKDLQPLSFSDFPAAAAAAAAAAALEALSPARRSLHASSSLYDISPPVEPLVAAGSSGELDAKANNCRCVSSILKKDGQVLSMAISNNLIYSGTEINVIRVWKLPEFTECDQLRTKACRAVAMSVSGFNDQVCVAYSDGKVRVWQRTWGGGSVKHAKIATIPSTGSYIMSYITGKDKMTKHMAPITAVIINPTGDILYSASLDTTVKVWRLSDSRCIESFQAHPQPVNAIAAGPSGILYTASEDATVRVWRGQLSSSSSSTSSLTCSSLTTAHSLILTLPAKNSPIKTLSLAAGGEVLYGGGTDGCIYLWLRASGSFSACHGQFQYGGVLQGHTHAVLCMASVGHYVVSGSADSTIRVWTRDPEGRHEFVALLLGHRGPVRCVIAYQERVTEEEDSQATGGCTICSGSLDGVLKIWRVNGTREEKILTQCQSTSDRICSR